MTPTNTDDGTLESRSRTLAPIGLTLALLIGFGLVLRAGSTLFTIGYVVIGFCVPLCKIFQKAGYPGWAAFVPVYQMLILARVARQSPWLVLFMVVPGVGELVGSFLGWQLARQFGKRGLFEWAAALVPIIPLWVIAFGESTYVQTD